MVVLGVSLALIGCKSGQECKVGFDFEGQSQLVEWWEDAGAESGKSEACSKRCSEIAPGDRKTGCVESCTNAGSGCVKTTHFGL